jgi:hypothetical protein
MLRAGLYLPEKQPAVTSRKGTDMSSMLLTPDVTAEQRQALGQAPRPGPRWPGWRTSAPCWRSACHWKTATLTRPGGRGGAVNGASAPPPAGAGLNGGRG